jgi:hypothetical protein
MLGHTHRVSVSVTAIATVSTHNVPVLASQWLNCSAVCVCGGGGGSMLDHTYRVREGGLAVAWQCVMET